MRRFLLVLELILALQRLDEGFLGEILGVGDVADNAVNLHEDAPQVFGNKAVLPFEQVQSGLDTFRSWPHR